MKLVDLNLKHNCRVG